MLLIIPSLVGDPVNLTGGIIATVTGLSASILSFLNRTTGWWSAIYFTVAECTAKDLTVDAFSMSFSLHDSVDFFISIACHTPTSSFLAGAILRTGTAIIRLATCVPREVQ